MKFRGRTQTGNPGGRNIINKVYDVTGIEFY